MLHKKVYRASRSLSSSPEETVKWLLDAERLPDWNPAFSSVKPARQNGRHSVTVHGVLKGALSCWQSTGNDVNFRIAVPGLIEDSVFTVTPRGWGVEVEHVIEQSGLLTSVIGDGELSRVPAKRLMRLANALDRSNSASRGCDMHDK